MMSIPNSITEKRDVLGLQWNYIQSWISSDGGVQGPVVHRGDLKRMFSVHDTPWTQHAVVQGLLNLYKRSGQQYWLNWAIRTADAQCSRQEPNGHFRWAGHEDDRFSSLVSNALADLALLDLAEVLSEEHRHDRSEHYIRVVELNIRNYLMGRLYRPELKGFAMNPVDYYTGQDTFVVDMNSMAAAAMTRLDLLRNTAQYSDCAKAIGERILSFQSTEGPHTGGFAYSDHETHFQVPLYTALTLSGLCDLEHLLERNALHTALHNGALFLQTMRDYPTALWLHKVTGTESERCPVFVAGAGIIGNALLDISAVIGTTAEPPDVVTTLSSYQYCNGAFPNYVCYDSPDNNRQPGTEKQCWEDIFPTPNWNAQAFNYLSRIAPLPQTSPPVQATSTYLFSSQFIYIETQSLCLICGFSTPAHSILALYIKGFRYGFIIPSLNMVLRTIGNKMMQYPIGRRVAAQVYRHTGRGPGKAALGSRMK